LKPLNASLSTKPLVAPKSGLKCNVSASFAAPPARRKTGRCLRISEAVLAAPDGQVPRFTGTKGR
jgi:hypothetical protein